MIDIKELYFTYSKKTPLFIDLSLQVKAGSITGLLGTNGAGKTTFLKLLSGLLNAPKGSISIDGNVPFDRSIHLLQQTYFLPEVYHLPAVKIGEYINAYSGFYPNFNVDKFGSILQQFKLSERDDISELSHGSQKKFLVSFALATQCRLLLLDEPTNGLDIPSKVLFRKILAGSIDEDQLVLISTHQVKDIENLIDHVLILQDGNVVFQEDMASISSQLHFGYSRELEPESILYAEESPAGQKIISKQMNNNTSEIDIEVLFNAVANGKN